MKTLKSNGSQVRSAAVRLSHAISLEDYKSDIEFLNNKGLADRLKGEFPNLANIEQHFSYYTYTVTIDLSKIGKDNEIELDDEIKIKRVKELLEIIKILNRDIRGREENLSPLFVIGGLYNINTPFFLGRINLKAKDGKYNIDTDILEDTMTLKIGDNCIAEDTKIGIVKNEFSNEEDIRDKFNGKVLSIQEFFEDLELNVENYYRK